MGLFGLPTWTPRQKRTPELQVQLACKMLDEEHWEDVYSRACDILGERISIVGPLDMTRNPLRTYTHRLGSAYRRPPFVASLTAELAALIGDQSASVTIDRYDKAGGRPMPTDLVQTASDTIRCRLGAGYAGRLIGWSSRSQRYYVQTVKPDVLELRYASDDPREPTVIRHTLTRPVDGNEREVVDEYDLTNPDAPRFRVLLGEEEVTGRALDAEALKQVRAWPWRYADGTPFHRIVIEGTPLHPYATNSLIEATLRVSVLWTNWGAGIVDAGHPRTHTIGLEPDGHSSDETTGEAGQASGPETIHRWRHSDPERPGTIMQFGPGYDPKIIGEAIREYELTVMSALGFPVAFERTGGEPTEQERRAMEELIASTYPECRRADSEVIRRIAATSNRTAGTSFSEEPYGCLYGEEITEALAAVKPPPPKPEEAAEDDEEEQDAKEEDETEPEPEDDADAE